MQVSLVMFRQVKDFPLLLHFLSLLQPIKVQVNLLGGNIGWNFLNLVSPVHLESPPPASFHTILVFKTPVAISCKKRRTGRTLLEETTTVKRLDFYKFRTTATWKLSPIDIGIIQVRFFLPKVLLLRGLKTRTFKTLAISLDLAIGATSTGKEAFFLF